MKATVQTQITIAAPPAKVFEYLTDLKYHHLWNPQTRKISTHEPLTLEGTFVSESRVMGVTIKAVNTATKLVPPRELEIENNIGVVKYTARFRLIPNGSNTLLRLSTSLSTSSRFWVFTLPTLKQLARRELRTDLEALKVAVEHNLK